MHIAIRHEGNGTRSDWAGLDWPGGRGDAELFVPVLWAERERERQDEEEAQRLNKVY